MGGMLRPCTAPTSFRCPLPQFFSLNRANPSPSRRTQAPDYQRASSRPFPRPAAQPGLNFCSASCSSTRCAASNAAVECGPCRKFRNRKWRAASSILSGRRHGPRLQEWGRIRLESRSKNRTPLSLRTTTRASTSIRRFREPTRSPEPLATILARNVVRRSRNGDGSTRVGDRDPAGDHAAPAPATRTLAKLEIAPERALGAYLSQCRVLAVRQMLIEIFIPSLIDELPARSF